MSRSVFRVVAALRRLIVSPESDDDDRALLQRFARDRDEAAFAELVVRHGPLVQGVCRRLLRNTATAEDVFQATFLVLAQKAHLNEWRAGVGPGLHAVAVRLCRKARTGRPDVTVDPQALSRVPAREETAAARLDWEEMKGILDEELDHLPETLRDPLVLCYLQGRTRDEAAGQLGVSLAKLKRRLERGRHLLHDRLSRRGITLTGAGLGVVLG